MKKLSIIALILGGIIILSTGCKKDDDDDNNSNVDCPESVTDSRDSKTYSTVVIGDYCWFAENLSYQTTGSYCYDDNASNCTTYGRLYAWDDAMIACPNGWHLASDTEWGNMVTALGGTVGAGAKLKVGGSSGFNAKLAGLRYDGSGTFSGLNDKAYYWTSTEDGGTAINRNLQASSDDVFSDNYYGKAYGMSARCVKD